LQKDFVENNLFHYKSTKKAHTLKVTLSWHSSIQQESLVIEFIQLRFHTAIVTNTINKYLLISNRGHQVSLELISDGGKLSSTINTHFLWDMEKVGKFNLCCKKY